MSCISFDKLIDPGYDDSWFGNEKNLGVWSKQGSSQVIFA